MSFGCLLVEPFLHWRPYVFAMSQEYRLSTMSLSFPPSQLHVRGSALSDTTYNPLEKCLINVSIQRRGLFTRILPMIMHELTQDPHIPPINGFQKLL